MIYIPAEWIKNPKNEHDIRNIISECLSCFKFEEDEDIVESSIAKLRSLGENKIAEELKKGNFANN